MTALLWLALAWLAGWRWLRRLIGDPAGLLTSIDPSPWPAILFRLAVSLWAGLLPLAWLTYLLAWLADAVLPAGVHPLLAVNTPVMISLAVWLSWPFITRAIHVLQSDRTPNRPIWARYEPARKRTQSGRPGWAALVRSLQSPASLSYLLPLVVWLALGILMMFATFYRDGSIYRAGYTVFSDFAPHTALVSSFSEGRNWPTEYPHFANDGISYHFMFFFLCGNLNYLGLPLDWAINLPSILGLMTFCILLGLLAVQLTGRRAAYLLAPLLLFCRSSFAFFTFLRDLVVQYGAGFSSLPAIIGAMLRQETYIGNTPNDSWGLWGVNVYANQRHLLPGLSIAIIIIFLFLPDLMDGLQRRPGWQRCFFSREFWRLRDAGGRRRMAAAILLGAMMPYFHGSVLVALLLILAVMAVFSSNRLAYLCFAAVALFSTLLQSSVFAGEATAVIEPAILFGFIAPDKSFAGVLAYLLEMSGILLPLVIAAFCLPGRRRKILLAAFILPLIFAFTISLTPDVTVNHKFIMISFAFVNIFIADLLIRLWSGSPAAVLPAPATPTPAASRRALRLAGRVIAVFLALLLTVTGLQEIIILGNVSKKTVGIDSSSPLVAWIEQNTAQDAVFVTAPYHYNAFYLSGRATWLGHAYYAWSAGHDTGGRLAQEQWLLTGCGGDLGAVRDIISTAGLDYLIIDDTLREHQDFTVDEAFFTASFTVVAEFPELGNMIVFDLRG